MLNKQTTFLAFALLVVTLTYPASSEEPNSVPIDHNSLEAIINLANEGDANAQNNLGNLYAEGDGVVQDYNEAYNWYMMAAQQGFANSQYHLGDMYYFGEGVVQDYNEALKWYTKAAEQGESYALYSIGYMYEKGKGILQDYNKAHWWYIKAAEQRNADAMYRLGLMYENGKGVNKNYEKASNWYKKATELGAIEANERLIIIFLKKYYKIASWGLLLIVLIGGFIYGIGIRTKEKAIDTQASEVDIKPKDWTIGKIIRRYFGSLFIYLIYWLTLWGAIKQVVGPSLSPDKAKEQVEIGTIESIWEYGWGDHYIWFLIIFCFVTYCSGVLAGATSKKKGAWVAGIANLPIVILMSFFYWFFITSGVKLDVESPIAWKIIFPLSIIGSIFFSLVGGLKGTQWQNEEFGTSNILGIRPLHWSWLWLVSAFYIRGIAYALVPIITWRWGDDYGPGILQILYLFIYGYPMYLMYGILSGEVMPDKNKFLKIISFIGIYLGGIIAAILFDLILFGLFKLISFIF